jgi:hypothetical protein
LRLESIEALPAQGPDADADEIQWEYRALDGSTMALLPEFPTFHDLHAALVEVCRRASASVANSLSPFEPELETQAKAKAWLAEPAFEALRELSSVPPPYPANFWDLVATAITTIALETYDPLELMGPFEAQAWMAVALAEASVPPSATPRDETVLLAETLGYAPEAMELARDLPTTSPVAQKVLRNWGALAEAAEQSAPDFSPLLLAMTIFASESGHEHMGAILRRHIEPRQEPGLPAAILASSARFVRGPNHPASLVALFAFDIRELLESAGVKPGSDEEGRFPFSPNPTLEQLLEAGRAKGGLAGRFASAEPPAHSLASPFLPGQLALLPRRASAFGSLTILGMILQTDPDLAEEFELVLGRAPMDTSVGFLAQVTRFFTLKNQALGEDQQEFLREFDEFALTSGLPLIIPDSPSEFQGKFPLTRLTFSRPRNRPQILSLQAQPDLRNPQRALRLIRTMASPSTQDNLDQRALLALHVGDPEQARLAILGDPTRLNSLVHLVSQQVLQGFLGTDFLDILHKEILAHSAALDANTFLEWAKILDHGGRSSEALELGRRAFSNRDKPLSLSDPNTQKLVQEHLWRALSRFGPDQLHEEVQTLGIPEINLPPFIRGVLHWHRRGEPLEELRQSQARYFDPFSSSTQAVLLLTSVGATTDTPLETWTGGLPFLNPDIWDNVSVPVLGRIARNHSQGPEALLDSFRFPFLIPLIQDLEIRQENELLTRFLSASTAQERPMTPEARILRDGVKIRHWARLRHEPSSDELKDVLTGHAPNQHALLLVEGAYPSSYGMQLLQNLARLSPSTSPFVQSLRNLTSPASPLDALEEEILLSDETPSTTEEFLNASRNLLLRADLSPEEGSLLLAYRALALNQRSFALEILRAHLLLLSPPESPNKPATRWIFRLMTQKGYPTS